jgi:hypothetical protein
MALAADIARRPSAISVPTGSTKTDSESDGEKEIGMDVYTIITERIIEKLEAGTVPWVRREVA